MHARVTRRILMGAVLGLALGAQMARADWRDELGTLRIGMLDAVAINLSPGEMERIKSAYSDALKMPAEIYRARDLPALVDALVSGRVDYAMMSAAAYASASLICACVEPLAKPVMSDRSDATRAVLFMDPAIAEPAIAASKGIAVPSLDSFNTYGAALAGLQKTIPQFKAGEAWIIASGTDGVVSDFLSGKVDGFIVPLPANRPVGSELANGDPLTVSLKEGKRSYKVAWRSEPIANGPHAVRQNLAGEAKIALSAFLQGLSVNDPDLNDILLPEGAVNFGPAASADYAFAINAAKALAASSTPPAP